MGIESLQDLIEARCQQACRPVDLLKMARSFFQQRRGRGALGLVVDAESCLDRLYGGFYPDWSCGGQWNRMIEFLTTLMRACHAANMDMIVFFNGGLESHKLADWYKKQAEQKQRIFQVLKHLNNKATPPPKVWWIPPACLRASLRMALRQLQIPIACSTDDHYQEVIAYCRENNYFGILAHDAEYIIFDPPHYFSSKNLKLTYKGALETNEFVVDDVAKALDLHPKRFCVLGALLGNHVLPEEDLQEFYQMVRTPESGQEPPKAYKPEDLVQAVIAFVRGLPAIDNLDQVGAQVFKNSTKDTQDRISRFKESVQYYINGTHEGFLKYRPRMHMPNTPRMPGSYPDSKTQGDIDEEPNKEVSSLDVDEIYIKTESGYAGGSEPVAPSIRPETGNATLATEDDDDEFDDIEHKMAQLNVNGARGDAAKLSAGGAGSSPSNNLVQGADWAAKLRAVQQQKKASGKSAAEWRQKVPHDVVRIASERHQKGLMTPWIYQALTQGEVKLPVTMEEDRIYELPTSVELYRPIRQMVYGILFDITKKRLAYKTAMDKGQKEQAQKIETELHIKEWFVPRGDCKPYAENVMAEPLNWKVPGIRRLWLGSAPEDKNCRLRAFFTCMRSTNQLMMNTSYVPQHLLVLCCVLRYMLNYKKQPVLRKHELDAFLAQAVSPLLHDVNTMQDMKLPMITTRGVQLGALFMRGVEAAVLANDACGAPIPWHVCCPWLFFDGKLFHFKLLKANNQTPLIDICDGHIEQVMQVERMRQAILEGLAMEEHHIFAKPPLPLMHPSHSQYPNYHHPEMNFRPAGAPPMHHGGQVPPMGRGRGLLDSRPGRGPVDSRGGQLQIAGVVVGNWGANTQAQGRGMGRGTHVAPHITSVGPRNNRGGPRGMAPNRMTRGRSMGRPMSRPPRYQVSAQRYYGMPSRPINRGRRSRGAPYSTRGKREGRGRGLTIENGDSAEVDIIPDTEIGEFHEPPEIGQFHDPGPQMNGAEAAMMDNVNQGDTFNGSAPHPHETVPIGTFE